MVQLALVLHNCSVTTVAKPVLPRLNASRCKCVLLLHVGRHKRFPRSRSPMRKVSHRRRDVTLCLSCFCEIDGRLFITGRRKSKKQLWVM